MRYPTSTRFWVDEAIGTLGYIKPEAAEKLVLLIDKNKDTHPKAIATSHRKEGPQITKDEKKKMGIRANAFFSEKAQQELTKKGLENPLIAHEQTILRASLAASRAQRISKEQAQGIEQWKFSGAGPEDCAGCRRLEDKVISIDDAVPTGPHDCGRDACAVYYMAHMDYLQHAAPGGMSSGDETRSRGPWWKLW